MSRMQEFPGKTCPRCGRDFTPGVNGMLQPFACDGCLGVMRDAEGGAWLPRVGSGAPRQKAFGTQKRCAPLLKGG